MANTMLPDDTSNPSDATAVSSASHSIHRGSDLPPPDPGLASPLDPTEATDTAMAGLDLATMVPDDDFTLLINTRVLFSNPDFVYILANALSDNYAFHRYVNLTVYGLMPTVPEVTAHLKLLAAFAAYKRLIVGEAADLPPKVKLWQVHVLNLVRRFVLFISGLMHHLGKPLNPKFDLREDVQFDDAMKHDELDGFTHLMLSILPPIDVLIVWHAFMLQPRLYYDHFVRNQFLQFALLPLPLNLISDAIDLTTFEYAPPRQYRDNYLEIIEKVGSTPDDFLYDVATNDVMGQLVNVHCPICENVIVEKVPLSNDDNTGFVDRDFVVSLPPALLPCPHKISGPITHAELQKRMVYADALKRRPLAGIYKYFSYKICHQKQRLVRLDSTQRALQKKVARMVMLLPFTRRPTLGEFMKHELPRFCEKPVITLLRGYLQVNPIHLTVSKLFVIWEDLVGAVLRQERFTEKMLDIDWLHNPMLKKTLAEAIIRYLRYLNLLTRNDHTRMLVPTLDIDLIWHTHQLLPFYYYQECMNLPMGGMIDHDDKVEELRLDLGFKETAGLYYLKFKEPYLICFCRYCLHVRHHQQKLPGLALMLTLGKKSSIMELNSKEEMRLLQHPLYLPQALGLTHVLHHSAIEMPTYLARQARKHLEAKYKFELPWKRLGSLMIGLLDGALLGIALSLPANLNGSEMFVFPPFAPILFDCRHFYEGLCCTIRDGGPNCHGVSGCSGCGGGSEHGNQLRIV